MQKKTIRIDYPVNLKLEDKNAFDILSNWTYYNPSMRKYNWVIVFEEELFVKNLIYIDDLSFCKSYSKNYSRNFFIGKILKALKTISISCFLRKDLFYCLNGVSRNFFHWHTEALPKILYVLEILNKRDAVFFFPFKLESFQKKELDALGIKYIYSETKISILKSVYGIGMFTDYPGYYDPSLIKLVADSLSKALYKNKPNTSSRLYVTRKNAVRRKIKNEYEIIPILEKYNFVIADFDDLSIEDQIQYSRSSNVLVSIHGASLTHMIFMKPGSKILELSPRGVATCYYTLALTLNLEYYYLMCDTVGRDIKNYIFDDFIINPVLFEKTLISILNLEV